LVLKTMDSDHQSNLSVQVPEYQWCGVLREKTFSTKSVYDHLTIVDCGSSFSHIWKAKIPLKIKIFTWLLENNAILTKDNMIRRKWVVKPLMSFLQSEWNSQPPILTVYCGHMYMGGCGSLLWNKHYTWGHSTLQSLDPGNSPKWEECLPLWVLGYLLGLMEM
jgi:hypothetical protein